MEMLLGLVVMAGVPRLFRRPAGHAVAMARRLAHCRAGASTADRARARIQPVRPAPGLEPVAAHADFRRGRRHALFGRAVARAPVALRVTIASSLDAERPDGHDGRKHSYPADGPAGQVSRTIRFRSIDHAVAPLAHGGLLGLTLPLVSRSLAEAKGSTPMRAVAPVSLP